MYKKAESVIYCTK